MVIVFEMYYSKLICTHVSMYMKVDKTYYNIPWY